MIVFSRDDSNPQEHVFPQGFSHAPEEIFFFPLARRRVASGDESDSKGEGAFHFGTALVLRAEGSLGRSINIPEAGKEVIVMMMSGLGAAVFPFVPSLFPAC